MKQLNVGLPDELHQQLKVQAATRRTTVSAIIEDLVRQWLRVPTPKGIEPTLVDDRTTFKTTGKTYVATHPRVPTTVKSGPVRDFSKEAQAKGKMGRPRR